MSGTLHGLLIDKAATRGANLRGREHHTAWHDFSKAFDSISHEILRQLIAALPIPKATKSMLKNGMAHWNLTIPSLDGVNIKVQRSIFQGDSMSPFLFVVATAGILRKIERDPNLNSATKGSHTVIAYMDDLKCHGPSRRSIEIMSGIIREFSKQRQGCGYYSSNSGRMGTPRVDW